MGYHQDDGPPGHAARIIPSPIQQSIIRRALTRTYKKIKEAGQQFVHDLLRQQHLTLIRTKTRTPAKKQAFIRAIHPPKGKGSLITKKTHQSK